jgi:hypothetical protein
MIGLTIAMLLAAQEAPLDIPARCRAVAVRLEGENLGRERFRAQHAGLPAAVQQATFAQRIRQIRAGRDYARMIRIRYPGAFPRDPKVDALAWEAALAEGKACSEGTR